MRKKKAILVIVFLTALNMFQFSWNKYADILLFDAVTTEEMALEIGRAVMADIGEFMLNMDFYAVEYKDTWIVYGYHLGDALIQLPEITIRKRDGKILHFHMS